ncbi:MAG: PAS domain S-box-containing protein [Sulfurimonas sp.]|jgi:PAS domain S-box-containing protein|uniref:PAS domain-containing protein n=1 Tax=Sulfurimonas sp. TaxID=2022749 RepID=UPI0039E34612
MSIVLKLLCIILIYTNLSAQTSNLLTSQEKEYLNQHKSFTFTGDPNWLPFEAFDKNGVYIGIVADYLNVIENNTNIKFEKVVSKTWSDAINLATSGKSDIISGDAADVILKENFFPIDTYIKSPIVIVGKINQNFILDINNLENGKIAIIKDYGYTADIYKTYPEIDFIEVANIQEGLECVLSETCDELLASYASVHYSMHSMNYYDLKIIGTTSITMNVTLFVNKEKPILHSILNKSMKEISKDVHNDILNKWANVKRPSFDYKYIYQISGVVFVFIILMFYMLYRQSKLNKKIEELNLQLQEDIKSSLDDLEESRKIAKLGIWTLYHDINRLIWNDDTYNIFDIDSKERIATLEDFFSAVHKDDLGRVNNAFQKHMDTREPYFITHKLLTTKNELKYVNEWCKTIFDNEGKPVVSHGIIQDITESRENEILVHTQQKKMLEQSTQIQEKLNKTLESFGANIIASDSDLKGNITYVSKAFSRVSGYTEGELLGKSHSILRHPSTNSSLFQDMWQTIQNGKHWHGEHRNLKKDGGYYWVKNSITPKLDENNIIVGYSSIRENITSEKVKEQFLANMSHEFRTPLNSILGFIDLIKEETKEKNILEYSKIIEYSGIGLLRIIEDILDFSKIESGQIKIEMMDFNMHETCIFLKKLLDVQAEEKGVKLILSIDESTPVYLKTDLFRLRQIISNLLSNAIKFTEPGYNVFMFVSYKNNKLNIRIKDEGKGIESHKLTSIFEEFSQENLSTTREYGGTGLGLSISKKLSHLLGGTINVKSELGVGSEFSVFIDAYMVEEVKEYIEHIEHIEQKDFSNINILLVEDNIANQLFMKVILKKMNIKFDIAGNGLEAISMFNKAQVNQYSIILMDENMPNMNGIVATQNIRNIEKEKSLKHTPIIAVTANALKGDRERFLSVGMDEYLTKPINKKKLEEALSKFI